MVNAVLMVNIITKKYKLWLKRLNNEISTITVYNLNKKHYVLNVYFNLLIS